VPGPGLKAPDSPVILGVRKKSRRSEVYNCVLSNLIGSATDRGAVYLAGTYRSVGRGWPTGYLLPDFDLKVKNRPLVFDAA